MKWIVGAVLVLLLTVGGYEVLKPRIADRAEVQPGTDSSANLSRSPKQYTVLIDVSASRPERMIDDGKLYVDSVIDSMNYGDRLFLLQMYEQGVNDPESRLDITLRKSDEITSLEADEALKSQRRMLHSKVDQFFSNTRHRAVMHTDILSTLSIVSEQMSLERRNVLVFLSDMLQSSQEFEFEHQQRMPPKGWIEERTRAGLIRPLGNACVIAIGADPSTQDGVAVRSFWQEYFTASGATLSDENFRTTPPPPDARLCGNQRL